MEQEQISKQTTPRDRVDPISSGAQASKFGSFVEQEDGTCRLALHVDGIHCAKCIQAIETSLMSSPHMIQARVNMSTARLVFSWRGQAREADHYAEQVERLGYKVHAIMAEAKAEQAEDARLLRYMAVSGFAMGNIMLLSVALWSSAQDIMGFATRDLFHAISGLIALPVVAYSGQPFFASAWAALRSGRTNMDVPISLALLLASAMSIFETATGGEHAYFDSAVMLMFFLLIGRWLDAKARGKVRAHATELLALLEGNATVVENDQTRSVPIRDLRAGDLVLIAAGEKVPSDAVIVTGVSDVDTSLITGESIPRLMRPGDTLHGGTLNLSAPLTCKISQPSAHSLLAEVISLMETAEQGRSYYVGLAEKAARLYTPVVHSVALIAFLGWFFVGGLLWQDALLIAIATLIITCPCALGLAVPVVQVLAVEWLMKRGVLVKSADALERLAAIDMVVFDKTGTLTQGQPEAHMVRGDTDTLACAASLGRQSKHPLSKAVAQLYEGPSAVISDVHEQPGEGIYGLHDGAKVFLGKRRDGAGAEASSMVCFYRNDDLLAEFTIQDALRPGAKSTIDAFKRRGIATVLLSGDRESVARPLADSLGIETICADILPNEKLQFIRARQEEGHKCLMVGDGLNDAPALAQAYISMSPSTGTDITQNTADLVFQGEALNVVSRSWSMARFSTLLVKQNFALAAIYNCLAIPIALMGFATPLVAAIAMSSSSLIVIGNSFRIRLQKGD